MKRTKSKKLRSNNKKIALIGLAVVVLFGAFGVYQYDQHKTSKSYAAAQLTQQCAGNSNLCLNAWNYGTSFPPNILIKVHSPGVSNNNFQAVGTTYDQIEFANTNYCIADNNNNPGDAKAALSSICSSNPDVAGWGVNFTSGFCTGGGVWLKNNHWHGYLGPAGTFNGAQFYLNNPTPWCFKALPRA